MLRTDNNPIFKWYFHFYGNCLQQRQVYLSLLFKDNHIPCPLEHSLQHGNFSILHQSQPQGYHGKTALTHISVHVTNDNKIKITLNEGLNKHPNFIIFVLKDRAKENITSFENRKYCWHSVLH